MDDLLQPLFVENQIQHYNWGERGENAFIPRLLGIPAKPDTPYAELWIGTHPAAPSFVRLGDKKIPLSQILSRVPESILGKRVRQAFDAQLPFLLKVLSAAEALSIQVHPNKEQAVRLHARDPEHYPDANHKPEIAIALSDFKALAGFRDFDSLMETLQRYPEIADFLGELAKQSPASGGPEDKQRWIRQIYVRLTLKGEKDPEALKQTLGKLDARLARQGKPHNFQEEVYPSLRRKYGDDVGLLSLFVLNFVELRPGEAFFIPAGVPHAYLQGNIIECMANSDNVVRAGLTPKFKDLKAMADILAPLPAPLPFWRPKRETEEVVYAAPVAEFRVTRLNLGAGKRKVLPAEDSIRVLLVIEGELAVDWKKGKSLALSRGSSFLLPADLGACHLLAHRKSLVFVVNVPAGLQK